MGSGKSTLAAKLADAFGVEVLSTDHIRRELIETSVAPAGYGADNYRADMRGRVYEEQFRQADEQLRDGQSIVLDGTFIPSLYRGKWSRCSASCDAGCKNECALKPGYQISGAKFVSAEWFHSPPFTL